MPCFERLDNSSDSGAYCPLCGHAGTHPEIKYPNAGRSYRKNVFDVLVSENHEPHGKMKKHHSIWKCEICDGEWVMLIHGSKLRTRKK